MELNNRVEDGVFSDAEAAHIRQLLRPMREAAGWSLRRMSHEVGVSPRTLSRLELCNRRVDILGYYDGPEAGDRRSVWAQQYSNALGVPEADFYDFSDAYDFLKYGV
jgi:hypothetical protein